MRAAAAALHLPRVLGDTTMADGRRRSRLAAGWTAAEEEDADAAAAESPVLSGEYQALEMSTMVSALAHVVAGRDDEGYYPPDSAMAGGGGYGVHPAQQWGGGGSYPSAAAPTPQDHFFPAGEPSHYSIYF
jgi:hypothetical protein